MNESKLVKHYDLRCKRWSRGDAEPAWSREQIVRFAEFEAASFSRDAVTVSDLLLASLRADRKFMQKLIGTESLTQLVIEIESLEQRRSVPCHRNHVLAPSSERLLVGAGSEARGQGSERILGRHVVSALLKGGDAFLACSLRERGLTLSRLQ